MLSKDMFFDSDNETDEINCMPKVKNYAEEVVPRFSYKQFRMHFRISPDTFEDLLFKIQNSNCNISQNLHAGRKGLPIEKQMLIFIWYLSNLESFRSVADRFSISKSTCWDVVYKSCTNLLKVNKVYNNISWPSRTRSQEIMHGFQSIDGFPRVIGFIDGCHIRITKLTYHPNSYCNRKNYFSVLLQGVCDHKKLFLDVYAGEPGSIHDMRLFRKSDLYQRINNGDVEFFDDSHLIGDLAYSLSTTLIVGFKNIGGLSDQQKYFNYKLSQCRVAIENAFGYLKSRFRRLKSLETMRHDLIALLIVGGCIMHNICILRGDLPENIVQEYELTEEQTLNIPAANSIINYEEENAARIKRNDIMNAMGLNDI